MGGLSTTANGHGNGAAGAAVRESPGERQRRTAQEQLRDFVRAQLLRGDVDQFTLIQTTVRGPTYVDEWPATGKADDLAPQIYARAASDAAESTEPNVRATYSVLGERREGERAARFSFAIEATVRSDLRAAEPPTPDGLRSQSMRQLNDRHEATNLLLIELTEQMLGARQLDQDTVKSHQAQFDRVLDRTTAGLERTVAVQEKLIEQLGRRLDAAMEKYFDVVVLQEDLHSEKHTRELEAKRVERKLARGDQMWSRFFPIIVQAIGKKLIGSAAESAAASAGAASAPKGATTTTAGEAAAKDENAIPEFSDAQKRALGFFLIALKEEEVVSIFSALGDESRARFEAVVESFKKKEAPP